MSKPIEIKYCKTYTNLYMYHKSGNFVVEIFSYSMLCTKIKHTKLKRMRIINVNMLGKGSFVQKLHKSKIYCVKYEIFAIYGSSLGIN